MDSKISILLHTGMKKLHVLLTHCINVYSCNFICWLMSLLVRESTLTAETASARNRCSGQLQTAAVST